MLTRGDREERLRISESNRLLSSGEHNGMNLLAGRKAVCINAHMYAHGLQHTHTHACTRTDTDNEISHTNQS